MNARMVIELDPAELKSIRHTLHRKPELGFEKNHTSELIADRLTASGYRLHRGLAKTGVVGTLSNGASKRAIGLRADLEALPITEQGTPPYASEPRYCIQEEY